MSIVKDSVGVSIAVSGTGFTPSMVVKWNSLDLATTIYGLTSAVAVVPDSLLTSVGVGVVSVSNSNGVSNSIGITVVESMSTELAPVLYVAAGLLGAMAFILGFGLRL
ncbi:MAG: hypothetical protein EPN22_17465 [Nitrospirae bacterium]|nr:MAG: hypothetical protein EPN22_17465 [Nitrospirota bacterium]